MQLRHEAKYLVNTRDVYQIQSRLKVVAKSDPHVKNGYYIIRSLYFDTPDDLALKENLAGISRRDKFRIRYYNGDLSYIVLEKKSKFHDLGNKQSVTLTPYEVEKILYGNYDWLLLRQEPLLREFHYQLTAKRLKPKSIVEYTRFPFIYEQGNVRVTFDDEIRCSRHVGDFLDPKSPTIPVQDSPTILEVKWDNYLPSIIQHSVQINRPQTAYSKYVASRMLD